jgi:tetratricopeptide (TPR) repeat protein
MPNLDETIPTHPEIEEPADPLADTQQTKLKTETTSPPTGENETPKRKRSPWVRRVLVGVIIFIVFAGLGGLGGYLSAINDRVKFENVFKATEIPDQFVRGLIDMENGDYEIARQRFVYILLLDPNHPGAADQLTKALLALGSTGDLPTIIPSHTLTPTLDLRNEQELYQQAIAYRDTQNWGALLGTLDSLRKANPDFMAVKVDGLYYIAFRNRGLYRIQIEGNLEGGIFDLNQAELFGLLDVESVNFRQWAEWYLTGASFWDLDWEQVVFYFSKIAFSAPNLSDSNYFTAQSRLATAQVHFGNAVLYQARMRYSQRRYCDAYDLFSEAANYVLLNKSDLVKFEDAKNICLGIPPTATPTLEGGGGSTPTP